MARNERDVTIRRPVAEVFAYMDDVSREPEWQPNIRTATQEPAGPTTVGTIKRYTSEFLGRDVTNVYRTTVYEPDRRVVYETTTDSTLQARAEIRFDEVADGTRVTMAIEGKPTGVLRLIPRSVLERTYAQELETTLARLKKILEA